MQLAPPASACYMGGVQPWSAALRFRPQGAWAAAHNSLDQLALALELEMASCDTGDSQGRGESG